MELATLANGCFWCTEAVFKRLKGVRSVTSGYADAAESLRVTFNPSTISFETLLDVFFATHDPTTLNRQGYDQGTEYRSVIFYHDEQQKKAAEAKTRALDRSGTYKDKIVTEIVPFTNFYKAEEHHQNFYESGSRPDYCSIIIDPKIQKLLTQFGDKVKEEYK